ncbi:MAG TPA: TetR/AcrR family transcriptional regulator [Burkholderiales bacterium]|jgi:AcrR family transcriptional regulator|nr:TetR/AcrR family transcriptional regulator [Burkholderiales bacterium]
MDKARTGSGRGRKAYHHGDLRKAALEQALQHINRTRDVSFTLRELAAGLGVSSTALYRHFDGKLALLAAVAEEGYRELLRRFDADAAAQAAGPLALMAARGRAYVLFAVAFPAHFRVMFLPQLRQSEAFPTLGELRQQVYGRLEEALEVLQRNDLLSGADLRDIALTSWATVHGLASLLVDGQVRIEAGSPSKEVRDLLDRVLTVQAEGFLADGVRLGALQRKDSAPKKETPARKRGR